MEEWGPDCQDLPENGRKYSMLFMGWMPPDWGIEHPD
jgi:hypothetical protein